MTQTNSSTVFFYNCVIRDIIQCVLKLENKFMTQLHYIIKLNCFFPINTSYTLNKQGN